MSLSCTDELLLLIEWNYQKKTKPWKAEVDRAYEWVSSGIWDMYCNCPEDSPVFCSLGPKYVIFSDADEKAYSDSLCLDIFF